MFFLAFVLASHCFGADETNIIALGAWSKPVDSLRARLVIEEGNSPAYAGALPETKVYLELQNVSTSAGNPLDIYFDPQNGLQCQLLDSSNQPPPQAVGGGSGAFPSASWIALPYDSTQRLRVSWYGYGMAKENGLKIPLFNEFVIRADNTNDYFLSGKFTVVPPANHVPPNDHRVWQGTLTLPSMEIRKF